MEFLLYHLSTIMVLAVACILVFGLWTMLQGKSPNLSQRLMRWRVGIQFLAIVLILAYALFSH
jgi:hypothetical protein